jgi:hypothetical protein
MLGLLATAATLATGSAAPAWRPDVDTAERFARTRRGAVSFAVRTECGAWGHDQDRAVPSASVLKAMLLVAELQRTDVRDRPLTAGQKALLSPMIRRSDNGAATRVLGLVGGARLQDDAKRWGMRAFHLRIPWGLSQITARDQARFWLHLDRRLPPRHRAYGLRLLRTIVPSQRWGVARAAAGPCTSRAAGARAAAPSTTRSRCCSAATSASRWRS